MDQFEHLIRSMETGFNTLADLQRETNAHLDQMDNRLERLEGRFDNLIRTAGGQNKGLREDVNNLQDRVGRLEHKVG